MKFEYFLWSNMRCRFTTRVTGCVFSPMNPHRLQSGLVCRMGVLGWKCPTALGLRSQQVICDSCGHWAQLGAVVGLITLALVGWEVGSCEDGQFGVSNNSGSSERFGTDVGQYHSPPDFRKKLPSQRIEGFITERRGCLIARLVLFAE